MLLWSCANEHGFTITNRFYLRLDIFVFVYCILYISYIYIFIQIGFTWYIGGFLRALWWSLWFATYPGSVSLLQSSSWWSSRTSEASFDIKNLFKIGISHSLLLIVKILSCTGFFLPPPWHRCLISLNHLLLVLRSTILVVFVFAIVFVIVFIFVFVFVFVFMVLKVSIFSFSARLSISWSTAAQRLSSSLPYRRFWFDWDWGFLPFWLHPFKLGYHW